LQIKKLWSKLESAGNSKVVEVQDRIRTKKLELLSLIRDNEISIELLLPMLSSNRKSSSKQLEVGNDTV
jgi:hypothetical protein